jgi:hypothetical protein
MQCTTFDTRKRPWYLNGISDSKDVKILVDVSNTMGSVLPVEYQHNSRSVADVRSPRLRRGDRLQQHRRGVVGRACPNERFIQLLEPSRPP